MSNYYLFVYGSMKKNYFNNLTLKHLKAEYVGEAYTKFNNFSMVSVNDDFPGIIKGDKQIKGELYELKSINNIYYVIDRLENYPLLYKREIIAVEDENNNIYMAFVYVLNDTSNVIDNSERILLKNGFYEWK